MSAAQVTEAHIRLANQLVSSPPSPLVLATLIADSEAKATAQLRADRDYNHECINRLASATAMLGEKSGRVVEVALSTIARAERAEAELHALRLVCGTTDADKFSTWVDRANARAEKAEAELATERARLDWLEDHGWITGEPCDRAAIDAAMKEGA